MIDHDTWGIDHVRVGTVAPTGSCKTLIMGSLAPWRRARVGSPAVASWSRGIDRGRVEVSGKEGETYTPSATLLQGRCPLSPKPSACLFKPAVDIDSSAADMLE